MKKMVIIDGQERALVCNALLPRKYRNEFGRDLTKDMRAMARDAKKDPENMNMELLENLTWLMLREGGEDVGPTAEAWMSSIEDPLAIYMVAGDVIELWTKGQKGSVIPIKK